MFLIQHFTEDTSLAQIMLFRWAYPIPMGQPLGLMHLYERALAFPKVSLQGLTAFYLPCSVVASPSDLSLASGLWALRLSYSCRCLPAPRDTMAGSALPQDPQRASQVIFWLDTYRSAPGIFVLCTDYFQSTVCNILS